MKHESKYLHQIGPRDGGTGDGRRNYNFNTLEEILASDPDIPLHFDGVYTSVYEHYKALAGRKVGFFFTGKHLGGDNKFDVHTGQPLSKFCTFEQIAEMAEFLGAGIGYHGWQHKRCVNLTRDELMGELAIPHYLIEWAGKRNAPLVFCWPYGDFDAEAIAAAKFLGYNAAFSCMQGDGTLFAIKRSMLNP